MVEPPMLLVDLSLAAICPLVLIVGTESTVVNLWTVEHRNVDVANIIAEGQFDFLLGSSCHDIYYTLLI